MKRRRPLRAIGDFLWCIPLKFYGWWFLGVVIITMAIAVLLPSIMDDSSFRPLNIPDFQELVAVQGIVRFDRRSLRKDRSGNRVFYLAMTADTGEVYLVPENVINLDKSSNISKYHDTYMRFLIDPKNSAVWQVEQGGVVVAPYSNRLYYVLQSRANSSNFVGVFWWGIVSYFVLLLLAARKRRVLLGGIEERSQHQ